MNDRNHPDEARMQQALALLQSQRLPEAKTLLTQILQTQRRHWEAWHLLGAVHGMLNEFPEAEKCARKAIELEPGAFGAYINLAHVLLALGKIQDAQRCYQRVLQMKPDEPEVHNSLGNLLRQQGKLSEAEASYRNALHYAADYAQARINLGLVLQEQGETQEAVSQFQQVVQRQPDNPEALHNLGCGLIAQTDYARAAACYEQLVQLQPDNVDAWSALGSAYGLLRRYEQAVVSLRQAVALKPDFAVCHFNLGVLLQSMGDMQQACDQYRETLRLDPSMESARYRLATLGAAEVPRHTPARYVQDYFDDYAERFDQHLVQQLGYHTPEQVYDVVRPHLGQRDSQLDAIDLGCGTGLGGLHFHPHTRTLVGVDLSPRMIAKARQRAIYSDLIVGDVLQPLQRSEATYDLIIATDVFVYIGDLSPVFMASAQALRAGGLFAFSIERAVDGAAYQLHPTGRYAHAIDYINGLAHDAGLQPLTTEHVVLRKEQDKPVDGVIVVLRKP